MGVRGLTSYVNSTESLWTRQTKFQNTKLVIDGSGLCNYLYRNALDCRCGGQYEEFYNAVLSFFSVLESNAVESFVVLDGAQHTSGKKLETHKKRANQRIETSRALADNQVPENGEDFLLPLLSKLVFGQALRNLASDHSVNFAVCDSEADSEVASLANAWNCPVLSNDSDFFIFDIKAGFIPLSSFDWKSSRLAAKIYHRRKLASHLRIQPELLPMFASLVGNDYVSIEALEPFNHALSRSQYSMDRSNRKEAKFARIANMLSTEPDKLDVLQVVSSCGGAQLRQAVEHSLQEYSITESKLLRYFQNGAISSSLRTQNGYQIDDWLLRKFREGQFSTKCMSGLTSGKVLLGFQVENYREKSANYCSQKLRRFVYGILNDAEAYNRRGNITMVEEWDREGLTVKPLNVTPCLEGVVRGSRVPYLDAENRLMVWLNALDSNTRSIKLLPEKFKLIAASLRFLKSNAQPPLKTNHISAILCCCIKLEDGSWKQHIESTSRGMYPRQPFDVQAAQSFAQWQCVLRDAVHLNFVLLEPVETPCIHKTFNGRLAQCFQNKLDRGHIPEELLPSSSTRIFQEICNALEREGNNSVALNSKIPDATQHQNSHQIRNSPTKNARQTKEVSTTQQQRQRVSSAQHNASLKRPDRPLYHSPVPQGGASWGLPLPPSKGYYQEQQYAQPSVYSRGHHAGKPQPVTPTASRVTQQAYTQQLGKDEISARNPSHSSKNFTAGENRLSRSALPPREVPPLGWIPPSSKSASAASYNPLGCRSESKAPSNVSPPRAKSTSSYPSASHCSPSSIGRKDEQVFASPARRSYDKWFVHRSSGVDDSPQRSSDDDYDGDYDHDVRDYEDFW